MPDFTQGKWIYTGNDIIAVNNGENREIACMSFHSKDSKQEAANAKLIAAAPDMYQWIEDARDFLSEWKLRCGDEDEMRAYWPEFCRTFHELLNTSELLMMRIDGMEARI